MTKDPYMDKLRRLVLELVDTDCHAVFLFGSRARGKTGRATDVNIGIWGQAPLELSFLIRLQDVVEESIVPYKVDFVDFAAADSGFKKIALENIEIWNNPPTTNLKEMT